MNKNYIVPKLLFVVYLIAAILLGISPVARDVWFAENMTVLVVVIGLVILYKKGVRFSNTSYLLMSVFIFMHTVGGHYTFSEVPFDWFSDFFGFERNHYDRIAHFSVGFYALPIVEWVKMKGGVANAYLRAFFALTIIVTVAAFYELFEWGYAVYSDPEAGIAVLGSQGDIWDAQKDMLADTLGAVVVLLISTVKEKFVKK